MQVYDNLYIRYDLSDENKKRLDNWHYHKPNPDTHAIERFQGINNATKSVAELLMRYCPQGRHLALALTALEDVRMRANAAIALDEV